MNDVFVVALVLLPALLTYFLRSNGGLIFLSVCAGYTVSILAGSEVAETLSGTDFKVRSTDIDLLFIFLPMAFSIFLTSMSVSGKSRILMHTVGAGLAGALFIIATAPFLNISLHLNLNDSNLWPVLRSTKSYVASGGAVYAFLLVWFFSKHKDKKHK